MRMDPSVLRALTTAMDCGIPPAMAAAVALAAHAPASAREAVAFVERIAPELVALAERDPGIPTRLAELEPELRLEPEVARIRPDVRDHELRGRLVFRDLVGKVSFFQMAALAIGDVDLPPSDAELLEQLGINTQLADARIWPLAVVRRVAARNGMTYGVLAGIAVALNPNMGARPVGGFIEALDRLEAGVAAGRSVSSQLEEWCARKERVPGVGRPVLGPDERNAQVIDLVKRHRREAGRSWTMATEVDAFFHSRKGQRVNSAGLQGAIMRDMGFSPTSASAFCLLYFFVQILAQAVAADERLRPKAGNAGHGRAA